MNAKNIFYYNEASRETLSLRKLPFDTEFFYFPKEPIVEVFNAVKESDGFGQLLEYLRILLRKDVHVCIESYTDRIAKYRIDFPDGTVTILGVKLKKEPVDDSISSAV